MLEGQVDDPVGRRGGGAQPIEVVERTAMRLGPGLGDQHGRGIRTGEPDDLVSGVDELANDGGADKPGRAGDEYTHDNILSVWGYVSY